MRLLLTALMGAMLCALPVFAKFAYERGRCDGSLFNVVQALVKNEMRALINPALRYSKNKILQFELYTPHNTAQRQILRTNDALGLKQSNFNPKWPVRFSIHGWTGNGISCSNAAVKDAYLARGNYNVIIVDWSAHSLDLSYLRITKQLPAIAASLLKFVHFLHRETGVAYESMYLIGHSAGSHIAGLAGKLLKPARFGVIFALDPAGLTQRGLAEPYRLAPSDAIYVESIHTDTSLLGNPSTELSQASFFVNWGQGQPQCPNATAAEFDFACDHFSALYYFAESVRNSKFFGALRCRNAQTIERFSCGCVLAKASRAAPHTCAADVFMGGEPAVPKTGIYYLSTHTRPPFGLGDRVQVRRPLEANFLRSSSVLSQRLIDKIFITL